MSIFSTPSHSEIGSITECPFVFFFWLVLLLMMMMILLLMMMGEFSFCCWANWPLMAYVLNKLSCFIRFDRFGSNTLSLYNMRCMGLIRAGDITCFVSIQMLVAVTVSYKYRRCFPSMGYTWWLDLYFVRTLSQNNICLQYVCFVGSDYPHERINKDQYTR